MNFRMRISDVSTLRSLRPNPRVKRWRDGESRLHGWGPYSIHPSICCTREQGRFQLHRFQLMDQTPAPAHSPNWVFLLIEVHYNNFCCSYFSSCSGLSLKPILLFYGSWFAHLSKCTNGCKQKCTQFLTLFSGTVIYALSHGVIRFARSVSPRNHFLTGGKFSNSQSEASIKLVFKANTPCKMDQQMVSVVVYTFV